MSGNDRLDELIGRKIDQIAEGSNIYHTGKVTRVNSLMVEATGLDDVFYFEKVMVGGPDNVGYVDKIDENGVYIALVKIGKPINVGDDIIATGEALTVSFSSGALGMILDPFGLDRLTGKKFENSKLIPIETPKIPIMDRTAVNRPLETGIAAIDLMYAIGKGQRQLVIGDKKIGKTQILLDTIVNQRGKNMICIYVAIGVTKKGLKKLYADLVERGAGDYTIIVAAFNDDPVPLIKMAPYAAMSIAEEFMKEKRDVLVCIDDLKKHADACREIALISEKNTGREAYPADIFYTHSRLLEKGCQHKNGGSITVLPVVETKSGDITDYISTNIISITDGQIVLSAKSFDKGQKPAVNFGLSVSRLGGAVQHDIMKKIGTAVRRELLSYLETADVYQLVNPESMPEELRNRLARGKDLLDKFKQPTFSPLSEAEMIEKFGPIAGLSAEEIAQAKNATSEVKIQPKPVPAAPKMAPATFKPAARKVTVEIAAPKPRQAAVMPSVAPRPVPKPQTAPKPMPKLPPRNVVVNIAGPKERGAAVRPDVAMPEDLSLRAKMIKPEAVKPMAKPTAPVIQGNKK